MRVLICLILTMFVSGCAGMSDTVITTLTDTAGNVTETVTGASIAKELAVHKTLQADVNGYYEALVKSGSKMEVTGYQEVAIRDGSKFYLPLMSATFSEAPKRNTTLPTAPSVHPAWKTGEKLISAGLWAFGIHEAADVFSAAINRPAYEFGDNNNIQNSFDKSGGDQNFKGSTQNQGFKKDEYVDEEGNCMVSPSCSCDSYREGLCE